MEEYFDAMNLEDENTAISDQEIMEISKQIGYDWTDIGITLGYSYNALEMLEDIYQKQPARRNFVMVTQWYKKISKCGYNGRKLLAKYFQKANRIDIADSMDVDYTDTTVPDTINNLVQQITFDREYSRSTGTVVLQQQLKVDVSMYSSHNPQQTSGFGTTVGLLDSTHVPQLAWDTKHHRKGSGPEKLYSSNKDSPCKEKIERKTEINRLLHFLSLEQFYPSKLTLQDVRKIRCVKDSVTEGDIPWLLLSKIIMLNYNAREEDLYKFYEGKSECSNTESDDSDDDLFEDKTASAKLNPADLFHVTFLCCDMILKLELVSKLFTCRLAIPFIFKDHNEKTILTKWGLRKILINKCIDEKSFQIDALNNDAKRVSFVRLGRPSLSKSRLLNELLSDQYHPTFFNRDCPLGASIRKVADGIVDASWYIPSGKQNDCFLELIMFLNLRGNCIDYKEELDILCALSHVLVVHTDVQELLKEEIRSTLVAIHNKNVHVIYALESCQRQDNKPNKVLKDYKRSMDNYKHLMKFFNLKSIQQTRSSSDITKDLRKIISETILGLDRLPLPDLIDELQISDETNIPVCTVCHQKATDVICRLTGEMSNQKAIVLPLQGDLWSGWCSALKSLYRSKSDEDKRKLAKVMANNRSTQRKIFQERMHPFFNTFLTHFLKDSKNVDDIICYLAWIQSLLDEKGRLILPHFILNYQKSWMEMKSAKEKNNIIECNRLYKQVDMAEKELTAAAFGLEHLIREIGQLYEATPSKYRRPFRKNIARHSSEIISKLLQNGHPFEIMDGDTAMVPLTWVAAVFDQLKRDIGDKQLLAVSVLGIQSSGKSTLLNAMFGLQFPVSAGRCTRGVYVQLVKVTDKVLPFSYVLVIDTEGLRAPELSDKKHMHDNELATFVLGLGDITIINIKGENTAEMENVLQIAVHAFLRLKMANGRLHLQQTCIFVHQNVPAVNATSSMTHGRQKMIDTLDKMTAEAASQEGLADINTFSQVIEIDPQSHMWYFSDLWFGDPPMAPVNLGYSRKVAEVKQHLLFDIAPKRRTFLSISETASRIHDLWNGILSDDFVFNFRNSLEMKAYHLMEAKFYKLTWHLDKILHRFKLSVVMVELARCENDGKLDETASILTSKLQRHLSENHSQTLETWSNYIDNNSLREIMEQWRQNKNIQLNEHLSDLLRKGKNEILKMTAQHKAELVRTKKRKSHERELQAKAQSLAGKFKNYLSTSSLLQSFNSMWKKWIGTLEHENVTDNKPVKTEIEKILFEHFAADRALLTKALEKQNKKNFTGLEMLKFSFSTSDIDDGDISILPSLQSELRSNTIQCRQQAFGIINVIFAKIDSHLSTVTSEDIQFEQTHVKYVLLLLSDTTNEHNKGIGDLTRFKFTTALKVKLAVHITGYITVVFTEMEKRYEEKHNITTQMEDYKNFSWRQFQCTVQNKRDEIMFTDMLIETVQKLLVKEIEKCLPFEVIKVIIDECFSTKYSLMLAIMKDLAEKGDFLSFNWYITDAETFAKEWIKEFTKRRIFGQYIGNDCRYVRIVNKLTENYLHLIQESLDVAAHFAQKDRTNSMQTWLFYFEKNLSAHLPVPTDVFSFFTDVKVSNFVTVDTHFSEKMKELKQNILEKLLSVLQRKVVWTGINPYISIFDKLWGCNHRCPFCRESCQKTSKIHPGEQHTCVQHRPPGLRGASVIETNVMSWETCNYKVCSNDGFFCSASDNKCRESPKCAKLKGTWHLFKDYGSYISDWEIEPSVLMNSSNYWMWFVYTYRKDLENTYGYTVPSEVLNWGLIEKEDAIRSLKMRGSVLVEDDIN